MNHALPGQGEPSARGHDQGHKDNLVIQPLNSSIQIMDDLKHKRQDRDCI